MALFWTAMSPSATPAVTSGHRMSLDDSTGDVLLFGVRSTTPFPFVTWKWDGTDWTQLSPVSTPAPASGYTLFAQDMIFDFINGKPLLVIHEHKTGGPDHIRFFHFDWGTPTWTEIFPSTVPSSIGLIVGGTTSMFPLPTAGLIGLRLANTGETWTWDGGTTWVNTTLLTPTEVSGDSLPAGGYGQTINNGNYIYYPSQDEVIYYGGNPDGVTDWLGTASLDNAVTAWTLNTGASWPNTTPGARGATHTGARFMAHLRCADALVVWGDEFPGDTATYMYQSGVWTSLGTLAGTPSGGAGLQMCTDGNGNVLKFGGTGDTGTYILSCPVTTRPQVMRWQ